MCGLTGFVDTERREGPEELAHLVRNMASMLRHRGPDDGGTWVDEAAGVALGHRRLSILDLSSEGHQPMVSNCSRFVIVYNGEIYNFADLRRQLESSGHRFRGHSDTEVLLTALAMWGPETALRRATGMFAFALWDRKERSLTLARDRLGEKPMYYGWLGPVLIFGSELKAFEPHPGWSPDIDRAALTLYLRHNYVPAPHSIFTGIRKLPAGCFVQFSAWARGVYPEPTRYWSIGEVAISGAERPFQGTAEEATYELELRLRESIRLQMVADVPVGAFLSGGIDSSTVVALMQAVSSRPVKTFTVGLFDEERNEAEHAKRVAAHLGTDHTELFVTPEDAFEVLPRLPNMYDEPFADSSHIPTYLIAALARQHVTVSLSGDGGDELFGGYPRYLAGPRRWSSIAWLPRPAMGIVARAVRRANASTSGAISAYERWDRLSEVLEAGSLEAMHRALLSNWVRPESVVHGGTKTATAFTENDWNVRGLRHAERMMHLDTITYLPDDLLVKVDRAAMATSLETRIPFLDPRVVEFAWQLPLHMKIRRGQTKWLLRQVLYRHLPNAVVERPKMGFGIPLGAWLRGPLRPWAEDLLSEERLRRDGYFDPRPIRQRWQEHVNGRYDWQYPLWCVLMFNSWLDRARATATLPAGPIEGKR